MVDTFSTRHAIKEGKSLRPDRTFSISRLSRAIALALGAAALCASSSVQAQVQPIVASSSTSLAPGTGAGIAVVDKCGNVYINPNGGLTEIQAGTGVVTVLYPNTNGYGGGPGLAIDQAKANIYFPESGDWYSSKFAQLPIVNCTPGTPNDTFANNASFLDGYYYGTGGLITTDGAGDVFFATTNNSNKDILEEPYAAPGATAGTPTAPLLNWPNSITGLASDSAGNLYFADSTAGTGGTSNIYIIKPVGAGAYATPILFASGFSTNVVGLSFDPQGNLYVADNGKTAIYEIPLEGSGSTAALNPAHVYEVVSTGTVGSVAVDASHNIYVSNYSGYTKYAIGSAAATQTAIGKSSTLQINYVFNTAQTISAIAVNSGTSASPYFTAATGGCAAQAYAAASTCSLTLNFTPTLVGLQRAAVRLSGSAGTLNSTAVSGVGLGAAATIDPGTVTPSTTVLKAPAGVAIDSIGNIFVTDSSANTLTEFIANGGGAGTNISTGSLTLKSPNGVAVDALGDIFIADTGNNRVVEIPIVNGTLSSASTAALSPTLKNPAGVAVDGAGNLYIADTGDNNLLFVPNVDGSLNFAGAQSFGTTLNGPSAVTVDANGNVYLAETGNKDVLRFAAPFGSASQVVVASGFSNPTGLSTDASGSLFVADTGAGAILRYPNVGGNLLSSSFAGSSLLSPFGVATDSYGNLYATDTTHSVVGMIARVQASAQFGTWNVGTTSDPLTGTVQSSGNTSLIFSSPSYTTTGATTAGFTVTSDGCAGATLLPGSSCNITATFKPPVAETNAQENLILASNAANGSPKLSLVGTGGVINATTTTVTLTNPTSGTLSSGQSVTIKAAIGVGSGTASAGGTVEFFVNGSEVGLTPVTGNAASLTLPSGLPGGSDTILAVYSGDNVNYSGSEGTLTEPVTAAADTLTLAAITPYNNPLSANDNGANATGPSITLVATLVPSETVLPGGSVTFYSGSTVLGLASVLPGTGGTFAATLKTTALRAGTTTVVEDDSFVTTYSLTATYSGDKTYGTSSSNAVAVSIVGPPTTQPACVAAKTCAANTTGAFFTITPANPTIAVTSTTVNGPALGSANIAINSYGGWDGVLNFTCSGLPQYTTCAPFPGYPTGVPSTPGATVQPTSVQFIINTNVAPTPPTGTGSLLWWASALTGLLMLLVRQGARRKGYLRAGQLLTFAGGFLLLAGSMSALTGCTSGSGYGAAYQYITPAGTSTITVKVNAAQLVPNTTTGATYLNDPNPQSFQITLVVK